MRARHTCPDCGHPVRLSALGLPIDPKPHPQGTVTIARWANQPEVTRHATPDDVPANAPLRYREHTCPTEGSDR